MRLHYLFRRIEHTFSNVGQKKFTPENYTLSPRNYSAHAKNYSAHNFYEVRSIFYSLGLPCLAMKLSSKFRTTNGGGDGHVQTFRSFASNGVGRYEEFLVDEGLRFVHQTYPGYRHRFPEGHTAYPPACGSSPFPF